MTQPLDPIVKMTREAERLKMQNEQLRSMNKKLLRYGGQSFENVIDELKLSYTALYDYKPLVLPKAKVPVRLFPTDHFEYAALMWSDWHVSERVRKTDTNEINEYSSPIAATRLWEVVQKNKKIIRYHQSMYPINKIWIVVLGDMINGTIHPELALTNDLTDPAATVLAARLLEMMIEEIKSLGIPVEVDCVVGNHPRLFPKMPTKRQAHTSYDWVVYESVGNVYRKDEQVTFRVHTGQLAMVEQLGFKYLVEHGIDVKNGSEEAFEDRIRALFDDPTYRQATGLQGASFDQILIGNLHKAKFLERTIVNGALTGQNELGMSWRLKPIRAQQLMFGISPKHVRTWQYAVDVTHVQKPATDNPLGHFAKWYMGRHGRA